MNRRKRRVEETTGPRPVPGRSGVITLTARICSKRAPPPHVLRPGDRARSGFGRQACAVRQVTRGYQDPPPPTRTYRAASGGRVGVEFSGCFVTDGYFNHTEFLRC